MGYFAHYRAFNDLSDSGRRTRWPDYQALFGEVLPSKRDARILDFGCGAGMMLEWLNHMGYSNAQGIDSDKGQVDFANGLGLKATLTESSSAWLAEAGIFDLILMSDVLEHISYPEDEATLHALYSALNPGGILVLRVPNANSSFASRYRYIDRTHHRSYTSESLILPLEEAGFQSIAISGEDVFLVRSVAGFLRSLLKRLFRLFRRIEAIAEFGVDGIRMPLSLNLLAVCRK